MTEIGCPLCDAAEVRPFQTAYGRRYLECTRCGLVHLDPAQRLDRAAELAHYGTHQNDSDDPRYRAFLARLADPLVQRLPPGAEGLDYGSGPGPALPLMLAERGFPTERFDPLFEPDGTALGRSYDFITCSESAEHFFHPAKELRRLDRLLRPGGWLAIMTSMLRDDVRLADWYYARDPTHVSLYRPHTMRWIARDRGWTAYLPVDNVVLFQKPGD